MMEYSEQKFEFPSAEDLRQSNVNRINHLRKLCIEYIQIQLEGIRQDMDLSVRNSFLIPYDINISDDLLLACTKEILKGKGYDISPINEGRSRGVLVKW